MKAMLRATVLGLCLWGSMAAAATAPSYKLGVDGLACPFCSYRLEKKLVTIKGVEKAEVDLATGTVRVTMADGVALDETTVKEAVKSAGFTLRSFETLSPTADDQQQ